MRAIELVGDIDNEHQLRAQVPSDLPAGQVRLIVLVPDEDETGALWSGAVAREWAAELADVREDFYTLDDGRPVKP